MRRSAGENTREIAKESTKIEKARDIYNTLPEAKMGATAIKKAKKDNEDWRMKYSREIIKAEASSNESTKINKIRKKLDEG